MPKVQQVYDGRIASSALPFQFLRRLKGPSHHKEHEMPPDTATNVAAGYSTEAF